MNLRHIAITGGTGSFGKAMVTRLLDEPTVEQITIMSRDELKQQHMRESFRSPKLRFFLGDVRNRDSVMEAIAGADAVFHAAALKQVPTGEFFPIEHVRTNILGTQNVLDSAEKAGVKRVVVLSTDKAAYPISVMGMTKAIAEKMAEAKGRTCTGDTIFSVTRYGNVMASRGSVIPLFVERIKRGEPLPVTNPEMTRFLLSLDDAIDLVLFAFENSKQGDLFIKKAPAATIATLAEALRNVFNAKNPIKIVGTRAGEKVHETLATSLELSTAEDMGGYYRIQKLVPELEYEKYIDEGVIKRVVDDYTSESTTRLTVSETEALLRSLPYIQQELKR